MGLDLSLTAPGLSFAGHRETLRTDAKTGDLRFCQIRDWLEYYVRGYQPALAMIEAVPPYDHASSVLERVHGVAREVLARYGVPFAYVNVRAIKAFATGNGNADKTAVMDVVEVALGVRPADDNVADAYVLEWMGHEVLAGGRQVEGTALQALSSITWPLKLGPWLIQPYGELKRKPVTKMCGHKVVCLKNGDHWLHPFNVVQCDKPPKTK